MSRQPIYEPYNLHPFSQMRTERIWEGKYDKYGDRREVDIAGCAMPFVPAFRTIPSRGNRLNSPFPK